MLEDITRFAISTINSTYTLLVQTFGFMDNAFTYLVVMILGFALCPVLFKSIYYQYAHPHEYYHVPLMKKALTGTLFIAVLIAFGYLNFIRFLPAG